MSTSKKNVLPGKGELLAAFSGGLFQSLSILGIISSLAFIPGPVTITIVFTLTIMLLLFLAYKGQIELRLLEVTTTSLNLPQG